MEVNHNFIQLMIFNKQFESCLSFIEATNELQLNDILPNRYLESSMEQLFTHTALLL